MPGILTISSEKDWGTVNQYLGQKSLNKCSSMKNMESKGGSDSKLSPALKDIIRTLLMLKWESHDLMLVVYQC